MRFKNWNTLTIGEYQRIFEISRRYQVPGQRTMTDIDADAEIIAILAGVSLDQVDRMKLTDYQKALDQVAVILGEIPEARPVRRLNLPGFGPMAIMYQVSDMDAGQYNEIINFTKMEGGTIVNLHKILATLAYPVKRTWWGGWRKFPRDTRNHEQIAQAFQDVPFLTAYAAGVFFYLIFKAYWEISLNFLRRSLPGKMEPAKIQEVERILAGFSQISAGYMPPVKWPHSKISPWNKFGVYQLCNTLTAFNTLKQSPPGNANKLKPPQKQPLEDNAG